MPVAKERSVRRPGAVAGKRAAADVVPTIELLGAVRVVAAGGVLDEADLRGRRGVLVLARLAMADGGTLAPEDLAEAVWGEHPPASWSAALRNTVVAVRAGLSSIGLGGALVYGNGRYHLALPVGSTVDVLSVHHRADRADRAAELGNWVAVSSIANGALGLANRLMLPGVPTEWVDRCRAELAEARHRLQTRAAEAALHLRDGAAAEAMSRQLVAEVPLREEGYRLLMRALDVGGNRGEAIRVFEACRRRLLEEVGVVPGPETTALFLSLLEAHEDGDGQDRRGALYSGPLLLTDAAPWFVGRRDELRVIEGRRSVAMEDGPQVVVVRGAAGVGKTRVASAAAAAAFESGHAVLYGRADETIRLPYRPFLEAASGFLASLTLEEQRRLLGCHAAVLARLLPSLRAAAAPAPSTGDVRADELQVRDAFEHLLDLAAAGRGAFVVLDDMQWSRDPSRQLLADLFELESSIRVLVVVVVRDDDALGTTWPSTSALLDHPRVRVVDVGDLDLGAVTELAARWLGQDLSAAAVTGQGIWDRTSGRPARVVRELEALVGPLDEADLERGTTSSGARRAAATSGRPDAEDWRVRVRYAVRVARVAGEEGLHGEAVAWCDEALRCLLEAGDPDPARRAEVEALQAQTRGHLHAADPRTSVAPVALPYGG